MNQSTTDNLLQILRKADTRSKLDSYLQNPNTQSLAVSFPDYSCSIENVKALSNPELITRSRIERTYFYQIMNRRRKPGRDKIIALALAAKIGLKETQRCLEISTLAPLYSRNRRDAIIIFAIEQELSLDDTNSLLDEFSLPPIV